MRLLYQRLLWRFMCAVADGWCFNVLASSPGCPSQMLSCSCSFLCCTSLRSGCHMCTASTTAGCEPLYHSSCSNESSITTSLPSERTLCMCMGVHVNVLHRSASTPIPRPVAFAFWSGNEELTHKVAQD